MWQTHGHIKDEYRPLSPAPHTLSTALNFELFEYLCRAIFLKGKALSFFFFFFFRGEGGGVFWISAVSKRGNFYNHEVLVKVIKHLLLLHCSPVSQHSFVFVSFSNNNR